MNVIGIIVICIILLIIIYSGYQIIIQNWISPKIPCPNGLALLYPANQTVQVLACPNGTIESAIKTVALLPTKLGPGCPPQIIDIPINDPGNGNSFNLSTADIGSKYTAGVNCGDIQVGLIRYCKFAGQDFPGKNTSCTGTGINATSIPATLTGCNGNLFTVKRRVVGPLDISSDQCPFYDINSIQNPVISLDVDPSKDYIKKNCTQPIGEYIFYECS
jgi:hypothetical protein